MQLVVNPSKMPFIKNKAVLSPRETENNASKSQSSSAIVNNGRIIMGSFGLKKTPGVVSKNPALNPRAAYLKGNGTTSNFHKENVETAHQTFPLLS